jgi:hypothetical protein
MKKTIIKFLLFLLRKLGVSVVDAPNEKLLNSIITEVNKADKVYSDTSGEHKRHQVYSSLIKKHPEIDKKELGYAIEVALRVRS